ncbi:hypothetical protein ACFE04_000560 [Oxalis oulophora]
MTSSSLYEQSREARIKVNLERMQKLGLKDLSLSLNTLSSSTTPNRRQPYKKRYENNTPFGPLPPTGPTRRSSRLQNVTQVTYTEVPLTKKEEEKCIRLLEGSRLEVYTEEHEKLLGNTEREWTCFVDGYGKDGKRIYDPVNGKTCHQCRQKTLGHRTSCSQCNMVQGQFCGDCLYMRYGEHVLEANENPDWTCPVCRGICNCSLCRQAKGWPATGALARRVSSLGFKSVAHYLIQTKREETEKNPDPVDQTSAKRSLIFSNPSMDSPEIEKEGKHQTSPNAVNENPVSAKRSLPFSNIDSNNNTSKLPKRGGTFSIGRSFESSDVATPRQKRETVRGRPKKPGTNDKTGNKVENNEEKENVSSVEATLKKSRETESTGLEVEVATLKESCKTEPTWSEEKTPEVEVEGIETGTFSSPEKHDVGGTLKKSTKSAKKVAPKPPPCPCPDSVAGRLRQRRGMMFPPSSSSSSSSSWM